MNVLYWLLTLVIWGVVWENENRTVNFYFMHSIFFLNHYSESTLLF